MSQQPAVTQPQVMDPDAAYAVVHNRVYAPVFFQKLANDYNIRPANQAEAMDMLTMAAQIRLAHDQAEKQAAERTPGLLAGAKAHLNTQLTKMGFANAAVEPFAQRQIKQAAVQASFDPELVHAILSMQVLGQQQAAA